MAREVKKVMIRRVRDYTGFGGRLKILNAPLGLERMQVVVATLRPRESLRPHYHVEPTEEVCVVVRGQLTVNAKGQALKCRAGEAIVIPPGVPHTVVNKSRTTATALFCFAPPQAEGPVPS